MYVGFEEDNKRYIKIKKILIVVKYNDSSKTRKAQQQLEEAEARAALAENRLTASKLKP